MQQVLKLVAFKQITSKSIFQDLVLQNCFECPSSDEQEVQELCLSILTTNIVESTTTNIFLEETNLISKF